MAPSGGTGVDLDYSMFLCIIPLYNYIEALLL